MKNKNNIIQIYMFKEISTLIILFLIIILVLIFIGIYTKFSNSSKDLLSYKVLMPLNENASEDMNYCLKGCVRGRCDNYQNIISEENNMNEENTSSKKLDPDSYCKYDFQCEYCQDKITNMFYVNFNNDRKIIPIYEEQKKLNMSQDKLLNNLIEENNEYIHKLNKQIYNDNIDYLKYKTKF
jgi:hypothetical protein